MFFEGRGSKTLVKPMFWRSHPFLKHRSSRGFKKKVGPWGGGGGGGGGYHIYTLINDSNINPVSQRALGVVVGGLGYLDTS